MSACHRIQLSSLASALSLLLGCASAGSSATEAASPSDSAQASSAETGTVKPLPAAINPGRTPHDLLIDDLDDGDHRIHVADERGGYWYTYADETSQIQPSGTFVPTPGGADGSPYAARMQGQIGDKQYPYAGMGFSFTDPKAPYDISGCTGITFKAKKGSPESTSLLRFKVGDVSTTPEGGVCKDCYNDFGRDVFLTEEWTEFSTPLAEMKQEPYWGEPQPALDATRVYQLQWLVKDRAPFDVWVDDVKFVGCATP